MSPLGSVPPFDLTTMLSSFLVLLQQGGAGGVLVAGGAGVLPKYSTDLALSTLTLTGPLSSGGLTTVGPVGVPNVVAYGRTVGAVAALPVVVAYPVGPADGTFEVAADVTVTTSTTYSFFVQCTYTAEDNVFRTLILDFINQTTQYAVTLVNTNAVTTYAGRPAMLRAKAGTTITILTQAAGTYTTVVYNAEGLIKRLA